MRKADITLTEMNGIIRITFVTAEAKTLAIDEPEFAPYVHRRDGLVYMDMKRTRANKINMVSYCRKHSLTAITE